MADSEHNQQVVLLDDANLTENDEIVTVTNSNPACGEDVGDDILHQALVEASEGFEEGEIEYCEENVAIVADENGQHELESVTYDLVSEQETHDAVQHDQGDNGIVTLTSASQMQVVSSDSVVFTNTDAMHTLGTHLETSDHADDPGPDENEVETEVDTIPQATSIRIIPSSSETTGTLGSSANPIRIVQQGNQYTSMQQLTQEQLSQIMQVVQQQQLAKSTAESGGTSILFNPQTQTRVVYRVIYPSELHSGSKTNVSASVTKLSSVPRTIQIPKDMLILDQTSKRTYKKRHKEEEDPYEGPELSKEEKEERKKHRPRTRSGRVSRPPKHMVKDYKHIHPLDWDEDYDDSDGGYSDFKLSDVEEEEEEGRRRKKVDGVYIQTGLGSTKPKKNKCNTCEKAYIGLAGLARHYRLNPDHGNAEDIMPANTCATTTTTNGIDSSTDESSKDSTAFSTAVTKMIHTPVVSVRSGSSIPRATVRTKAAYVQESTPSRRKLRLKELVRQCGDEELMEIVLPRLAKVITVWEFLLMKVEKGRPSRPHIQDVYKEFELLNKEVSKMCSENLSSWDPATVSNTTAGDENPTLFHLNNAAVAQSLGLNVGAYVVKEPPNQEEAMFEYKYLTTDSSNLYAGPGSSGQAKRTIQLVDSSQLVVNSPPAKRTRLTVTASGLKHIEDDVVPETVHNGQVIHTLVETQVTKPSVLPSTPADSTPVVCPQQSAPEQTQTIILNTGEQTSNDMSNNITLVSENSNENIVVTKYEDGSAPQTEDDTDLQENGIQPEYVQIPASDIQSDYDDEGGNVNDESKQEINDEIADKEQQPQHIIVQTNEMSEGIEGFQQLDGRGSVQYTIQDGQLQQHYILHNQGEGDHQVQVENSSEEGVYQQVITDGGDGTQIYYTQEGSEIEGQDNSTFQGEEQGLVLIQNPDGTYQIHGHSDQPIPLETVQALFAMDAENQTHIETTETAEDLPT